MQACYTKFLKHVTKTKLVDANGRFDILSKQNKGEQKYVNLSNYTDFIDSTLMFVDPVELIISFL